MLFTGPFLLRWCDSARKQRVGPGFRHLPGVFSRFAFYSGRCLRSGRTCDLVGTAEEDAHKGVFHGRHLFGLASQCFNLETAVVRFTSTQVPAGPQPSALPIPPPAARAHLGPVSRFSKSFELFAVFFVANVSHDAVPELLKSVISLGIVGARRHKCARQAALNPASAAIAFRGRMAISLRSETQHPQGEPQARGLCALTPMGANLKIARCKTGQPKVCGPGQTFVRPAFNFSSFLARRDAEEAVTAQIGGGQARLTLCDTRLVVTTRTEWGVTERFVSGGDFNNWKSISPSVDVQSVPV